MLVLLFAFCVVGAVLLAGFAFARPRSQVEIRARLRKARVDGQPLPADGPARGRSALGGRSQAIASPFAVLEARLAPAAKRALSAETEEALLALLRSAGAYGTRPSTVIARRWLYAAALPVAAIALAGALFDLGPAGVLGVGAAAAVLGYHLPISRLRADVARRHRAILRALPSVLDLLTACVEAGLGLQAALAKVVEVAPPSALSDELARTLKEIQLGRPRAEALRDLGRRVGLRELTSVALALVQAEQAGASIGKTLRDQSGDVREARWQRAQELAYQAPLKMVFPVAFLIFPVIFVVIFGPLLLGLLTGAP